MWQDSLLHQPCETSLNPKLDALFGNRSATQTLLFLQNYGEGYARGIASTFDVSHMAIQRQLRRFEAEGIIVSRMVGNTRIFTWNPRSATVKNLRTFLEAELELLPKETAQQFFRQRQRPRRSGKAL